jgi:hypothetical protein
LPVVAGVRRLLRLAGVLGYRGGMQPRLNGIALISDDVLGLSAFYAGLVQASVEGDGAFAFKAPSAIALARDTSE